MRQHDLDTRHDAFRDTERRAHGLLLLTLALFAGPALASTPDPTFGEGGITTVPIFGSADNRPGALLLLDDGRFLVGGDVVARYEADGSVDTRFGQSGSTFSNVRVESLATQSDGSILAAGIAPLTFTSSAITVVRLGPDGTIDRTFGADGRFQIDLISNQPALAVLEDDRILVAGCERTSRVPMVFRLGADGTLDTTFGDAGFVIEEESDTLECARSIALQPDGRVLVAGEGDRDLPPPPVRCGGGPDAFVLRYLADGSRDPSFGSDGLSWVDVAGCDDVQTDLALRPDGRILLGILAEIPRGSDDFDEDIVLAQLLADGSPDVSFGTAGFSAVDYEGGDDEIGRIALAPDGSIYAVAEIDLFAGEAGAVLHFLADGSLDTAFGNQGTVLLPDTEGGNAQPCCVQAGADGLPRVAFRIPLAGEGDFGVAAFLADGSFDLAFGEQGIAQADFLLPETALARNVLEDDAGRLYQVASAGRFLAVRYTASGALDPSWGEGGVAETELGFRRTEARRGVLQPDGRLIIAGEALRQVLLARYTTDGQLDPSFGSGGTVVLDVPNLVTVTDVGLQSDGRIVVGMSDQVPGGFSARDFVVYRFDPSGNLDASFGAGGIARIDRAGSGDELSALEVLDDDRLLVAGLTENGSADVALARLTAAGAIDPTFGTGGWTVTDFRGFNDQAVDLEVASDGTIVLAGGAFGAGGLFDRDIAVVRYLADGALDPTFGSGGVSLVDLGGTEQAATLGLTPDGSAYVAGLDSAESFLLRLTVDGALDPAFGTQGVATYRTLLSENTSGLRVQTDRVIMGGNIRVGDFIGAADTELFVRAVLQQSAPRPDFLFASSFEADEIPRVMNAQKSAPVGGTPD